MRDRAAVYDERTRMRQYDRCACGKMKGRSAERCKSCWTIVRRNRGRLIEERRAERRPGSPRKII